jgi:sodium-dependent dicarboxylate transporter 2/3/5
MTDKETTKGKKASQEPPSYYSGRQKIGLLLGPLLFILIQLFFSPEGLSPEGRAVLASTLWIATWWITEAIPIPATSLLPIILFPLTEALPIGDTTASYGNHLVFLFLGGFMIALTIERWNLHKRIALTIISMIGTSTKLIVMGFMIATALLSMWISNTATSIMMVPIGLAIIYQVVDLLKDNRDIDTRPGELNFGKALMLGIAYSASIGGLGTIIGTPPNVVLVGVVDELFGVTISFLQWMLFGLPLAIVLLFITWYYLVNIAFPMKLKEIPGGKEVIKKEQASLGKMAIEEKWILTIFSLTALAWITREFLITPILPGVNDTVIALTGALILFVIPSMNEKGKRLLDWDTAIKLPWGIILLFGGGFAIAAGFSGSGLAEWIGDLLLVLEGVNFILIIAIVTFSVIFLTEITSNTATASMIFPVMASLAYAIGVHPFGLMVAAAIAASCAFMLPVATPPNAVVFGSGYIKINDMVKAGIWLNVFCIILITLAVYLLLPAVWGIDLRIYPNW